jgi:hypothetical protein
LRLVPHGLPRTGRQPDLRRELTGIGRHGRDLGGLLGLDGAAGLRGWQWLFLAQGLPAVVLVLSPAALPARRARDAPWLADRKRSGSAANWLAMPAVIGAPSGTISSPRLPIREYCCWARSVLLGNGAGNGLLLSAPAC